MKSKGLLRTVLGGCIAGAEAVFILVATGLVAHLVVRVFAFGWRLLP